MEIEEIKKRAKEKYNSPIRMIEDIDFLLTALADREKEIERLQGEQAEWLCIKCNTVHPLQYKGKFLQPCPMCKGAMTPTSYNLRVIDKLNAEIANLRERLNKQVAKEDVR